MRLFTTELSKNRKKKRQNPYP